MKLHLTNAEVGMWNAEGWSRFAKSFRNRQNTLIRRSMLDVRCSTFISFFSDQTGRLRPGGAEPGAAQVVAKVGRSRRVRHSADFPEVHEQRNLRREGNTCHLNVF